MKARRVPVAREVAIAALALLLAMAVGSLLIIAVRRSPLEVYGVLFARSWGRTDGLGEVVFLATPLIFTGLAFTVAARVGLFNIGGEGQLIAGCVAAAAVGAALPAATPALIAIPACLVAAVLAGAALGAAIGGLRAWRGAHEVVVAIMVNAIVAGVALWLGNAALFVGELPLTAPIAAAAELPELGIGRSNANASIVLALVVVAAVAWGLSRTAIGFRWRVVGAGPRAAECAGIDVRRAWIAAMAVSGGLAGLAAASYVLGYQHGYTPGLGSGAGFMGIAVALLGRHHPVGIVVAAFGMATLSHGGQEIAELVPRDLINVLQAVIIFAIAATTPVVRRKLAALVTRDGAA